MYLDIPISGPIFADHFLLIAMELRPPEVIDSKIGAPLAYSAALRHPLQVRSAYATGSLGCDVLDTFG